MTQRPENKQTLIEKTISQRTGVGANSLVSGWQSFLTKFLEQMDPYLQPGKIITFQHLHSHEMQRFQEIVNGIHVPEGACGVFMPPSVRNQLLYTNQGMDIPSEESEPRDDGVILFTRSSSHATIVNVLLAHLPCTPAVDVYDRGALLAGYVYDSITECLSSVEKILQTHLRQSTP